jgi:hypothetical protein
MKRRFNDQQSCAHAWAHQLCDEGHASNFFFEGRTIYSYGRHFPIAFLQGSYVFFTLKKYSATTSCHKSIVLSAVSHKEIIYVEYVPESTEQLRDDAFHKKNINHWVTSLTSSFREYEVSPRKKSLAAAIQNDIDLLKRFLEALEIEPDALLQELLTSPSLELIAQRAKEEREKTDAANLAKYNAALQRFRAGLISSFYEEAPGISTNTAYLRYNEVTNQIETSKGVKVPARIAKRFWNYIQKTLPEGCVNCNYSILDFKVAEISPAQIVVGCHTISMEEINEIVRLLKW